MHHAAVLRFSVFVQHRADGHGFISGIATTPTHGYVRTGRPRCPGTQQSRH